MSTVRTIGILIVCIIAMIYMGTVAYQQILINNTQKHRSEQANSLRFLQIKIPKKDVSKAGEEWSDVIHSMKQNSEIMNQVYKNLYAIYDDSSANKKRGHNYISMEMYIERETIKFAVGVPEDHVENFEKMISSFYVGSVIDPIPQPKFLEAGKYMDGGEFLLNKDNVYPIKTYESFEADPMDSLLSAYARVLPDEKLCLQILISPMEESILKTMRKKAEKVKNGEKDESPSIREMIGNIIPKAKKKDEEKKSDENKHDFSSQQSSDIDRKFDDELFSVKIRAFATSPDKSRPEKIINDLARGFNQYNYSWLNSFRFSKTKDIQQFAHEFITRIFFSHTGWRNTMKNYKKETILNIKELSSLVHFPHAKFNRNPRIIWQKYKVVAAPDNLPDEGMLIGYNLYNGVKKDVRLKPLDRFRHVYIVGQTGTGKTTLMLVQAKEDLKAGNGFCFLDPHGDVCEDILASLPKERVNDLIYFDLSNTEYPIGFNVLEAENEDERDIVTNDLVEMFVNMYGHEIFGPRIQDYFRNACFLLMEQPDGGTLVEIMRLFTDPAFLESKLRNLTNPVISARWNKTYKAMGDREKAEIIPFLQAKFGPFTTGVYVRNIIGQPKSAFKIFEAMQQNKIILCNLSKGLAGEVNSQLIGRMIVTQLKLAALKRAKIDQNDRVPYYLYIDEFQNYVSQSIESILSEARKYRLWLTVAHQYIEQLKQAGLGGSLDLSKAIFGNVGTIFSLKVGAPDAEFLEKEFTPEFSQADLINMDKFKGIMKLSVDSQQSRPFSFTPLNPFADKPLNNHEKVAIIKQISALKRGTKRELADKEIYYRVGV